jgi:hypothetical protein
MMLAQPVAGVLAGLLRDTALAGSPTGHVLSGILAAFTVLSRRLVQS